MAIKLNTTSGSITLEAEDGSGNVNVTVPREGFLSAFVLEDDDGTEVSISNAEEVKFIGSGITTNWTDTSTGSDGDPFDMTFSIDAAQTGITSIYATDLIIGEDSQTAIDFGTVNEIDFKIDNAARLTMTTGTLEPVTDDQIDLGTSSLKFKDAFFDGTVNSDAFAGPLTGDVTGNCSGTAATVTTAAQTAITSVGTLTALTVDNVAIDGAVIGHTSDTDLMTLGSAILTVAGEVSMTTLDIGGTNVTSTATELNILDGVTSTTAELNILDGVTSTAAELNLLDGLTDIGYKNIPQNSQSAAYTCVLADSGKHIHHPSGDANARTYTIPANSSVAYPIGTAITFTNLTSQVVTIAITSDTMYLARLGTTGSRSLAQYGMATALKTDSTKWIITGNGLT